MKRHHPFNLVEILIALGVTVIGICSIMVLFPIGANASSNAAMETYAANAADQMLNYLKFQITASEDNWKDMVVGSDATKGALKEIADIIDDDDDLTFDQSDLNDDDNWTYKKETSKHAYFNLKDMNGTIYSYCPSADTKANNLFQFISHRNELDSSGNPSIWAIPTSKTRRLTSAASSRSGRSKWKYDFLTALPSRLLTTSTASS